MSRSYIWQATRPGYGSSLEAAYRARDEALRAIARSIFGAYRAWRRRHRRIAAIRELEELDERMLHDIGLSRASIQDAVDGMLERRR
jgi:uncharacterized protein YjiS (DUF1127 family)